MTTQHVETLIIGAGQAGLATGYHLQRMNRPILIVDANERLGDNWRQHYDSLRLYYAGEVRRVTGYGVSGSGSVELSGQGRGGRVPRAVRDGVGSAGADAYPRRPPGRAGRAAVRGVIGDDIITCDNVVVATGTFGRTPNVPGVRRCSWIAPSVNSTPASIAVASNCSRALCWWWELRIPAPISPTKPR